MGPRRWGKGKQQKLLIRVNLIIIFQCRIAESLQASQPCIKIPVSPPLTISYKQPLLASVQPSGNIRKGIQSFALSLWTP
jgi:hypothetical protein